MMDTVLLHLAGLVFVSAPALMIRIVKMLKNAVAIHVVMNAKLLFLWVLSFPI